MPELPEVETVRRTLVPLISGRVIVSVAGADFPDVMGAGGLDRAGSLLGRAIDGISRRGKYLAIDLDDDTALLVHLRMTGQLVAARPDTPSLRFQHLTIGLASPGAGDDDSPAGESLQLRFADQRRFGRVLHVPRTERDEQFLRLGPEPLGPDFTPSALAGMTSGRKAPIKNILLDQRRVAGLGNIYVDEALFRAGVHPLRAGDSLTEPELVELHAAIVTVLEESLARRGTTFSSFLDGYGDPGENGMNLRVYGRARTGEHCVVCGTTLNLIRLGGRSTSFCPRCQRLDTSASAT
ncbi:MAG TPA: bifunctional DNA-formamidopyrimidine glycosylase/DNA-(apurinic or apyrimidinic site) lyase [Thermomicrobiales bacterium]|jgi:formamidopyrimidine-DNA glycosylase|nr:bifunctional DNA-formamidopyrimidine glycosylase/DNA-(apurinic or apyrimidinic site) lyase [Thermomicrobiales bacterium]